MKNKILFILLLLIIINPYIYSKNLDIEFIRAASKGDLSKVKYYLSKGVRIDTKDRNGRTALIYASQNGHYNIVKYLVEKGADVNIISTDKHKATALTIACYNGHLKIVNFLVENKANIFFRDAYGYFYRFYKNVAGYLKNVEDLLKIPPVSSEIKVGKLYTFNLLSYEKKWINFNCKKGSKYKIYIYDKYNSKYSHKAVFFVVVRKIISKKYRTYKNIYTEKAGDGGYSSKSFKNPSAVLKALDDIIYIYVEGSKAEYSGKFGIKIIKM